MQALILTNEYPPNVYGGAGVHVEYLTPRAGEADRRRGALVRRAGRATRARCAVRGLPACRRPVGFTRRSAAARASRAFSAHHRLRCRADVDGRRRPLPHLVHPPRRDPGQASVRHPAGRDHPLAGAAPPLEASSSSAAATTRRPGSSGRRSRWPTPSSPSRRAPATTSSRSSTSPPERIRVIHNGIDPDQYRPHAATDASWQRHGIDPTGRTSCSSAGSRARRASSTWSARSRISTRGVQVVLCAGAPDTPEIAAEMEAARRARPQAANPTSSGSPRWCQADESRQLYSHAAVFCCPSVYEPFGIINLEAMACETAVVATPSAASRKSSSTARRGCWCHSNPRAAGHSSPGIRTPSSATWRPGSTS